VRSRHDRSHDPRIAQSPDDFDLNLWALVVAAETKMVAHRKRKAALPPAARPAQRQARVSRHNGPPALTAAAKASRLRPLPDPTVQISRARARITSICSLVCAAAPDLAGLVCPMH
jgi:hypothetical protein